MMVRVRYGSGMALVVRWSGVVDKRRVQGLFDLQDNCDATPR
jgi:hypothetical protein